MLKDYKEQIKDADLVLVGVGHELRADKLIDFSNEIKTKGYQDLLGKEDDKCSWMRTVYERNYMLELGEVSYFQELEEVLEGKDYFVITSNDDGLLYHTKLDKNKVVAPCGTGDFFQCEVPCEQQLYPAKLGLEDLILHYEATGEIEGLECPKCGKPLIFNVRTEGNVSSYVENAYISTWAEYTKWLQNTLNKKIFILELGEGFYLPDLFRWPFEKIAFYNKKATMVRVHQTMYQLGEELKDKGISVKMDSKEFIEAL